MTFDPEPYAAHYREANEAEAARISIRAEAARVEAARVARIISDSDAAVRRVILFGSLAKGMPRSEGFDIDLALDGGDLYRALDAAESSEFDIDLVDLRLVPEHVRARILDEGIVLASSDMSRG
jgi:predicted nucleotidyltransferase